MELIRYFSTFPRQRGPKMVTADQLTIIFCQIDDFCKELNRYHEAGFTRRT
jgi:hypothetical protein